MESLTLIGNVLGYLAVLSGLLIYVSVKRTRILLLKICSDVLFLLHQFCLGMISGGMLSGIAIVRSLVFYQRGRHKWADNPLWVMLFLILTLISPILTWQGPVSLLPAIGSVVCVFAFYVKNTLLLRILSIIGEGLWLIYGVIGGSVQLALFGTIALISISLGMVNEWRQKRKKKKTAAFSEMD